MVCVHTEVFNLVTRLEVESLDSDPESVYACAGSFPSCNGVLPVIPMTASVFAMLVNAPLTPFVAAFTQSRGNDHPVAVSFVHGEDQHVS